MQHERPHDAPACVSVLRRVLVRNDLVAGMSPLRHFGDPCVHCGTPHDSVAPGPCLGDPTKAVPIAFRSLGVRWDNVERFFVRMSDGRVEDRHYHIAEWADYHNFEGRTARQPGALRYDETLTLHGDPP